MARRRRTTLNACTNCRGKRTKCDGQTPCSACRARGQECMYRDKAFRSKDSLRSEIARLKKEQRDASAVLEALKSQDRCGIVLDHLRRGESVASITGRVSGIPPGPGQDTGIPNGLSEAQSDRSTASVRSAHGGLDGVVVSSAGPDCAGSRTWVRESISTLDMSDTGGRCGSVNSLEYASSSSDASPDALSICSETSTDRTVDSPSKQSSPSPPSCSPDDLVHWAVEGGVLTRKVANMSFLQHHLGLLFMWECPVFTMLSKENLMCDFLSGGSRYCTPALVAAILSLATPLWADGAASDGKSSTYFGDKFDQEATGLIAAQPSCDDLPTAQALGLLALREVSNGKLAEAQRLASSCAEVVVELCSRESQPGVDHEHKPAVIAVAFCGAVSLSRMIAIVTRHLAESGALLGTTGEPGLAKGLQRSTESEAPPSTEEVTMLWRQIAPRRDISQPVPTMFFELTELVYSTLSRLPEVPGQESYNVVRGAYEKCLQWYGTTSTSLEIGESCTPHVLFMHIYYHFCLLALFRPLAPQPVPAAGQPSPRAICAEAAGAILALTQSHARLFSLRRVPRFLPLFVYAAGLVQADLAGAGRDATAADKEVPNTGSGPEGKKKSSGGHAALVALAVLQLGEMAVLHPAAAEAEGRLRASCGSPLWESASTKEAPDVAGQLAHLPI